MRVSITTEEGEVLAIINLSELEEQDLDFFLAEVKDAIEHEWKLLNQQGRGLGAPNEN